LKSARRKRSNLQQLFQGYWN